MIKLWVLTEKSLEECSVIGAFDDYELAKSAGKTLKKINPNLGYALWACMPNQQLTAAYHPELVILERI
jgi:hypothetical protein